VKFDYSPVQMQIGRWLGVCEREHVAIGCERWTIAQWYDRLNEIAEEHEATDMERALALAFLALCADVQANPDYGKAVTP
jgi:hypothetical protein